MINSRQPPSPAPRPAPTAAPADNIAGLLPLVEQVLQQLTRHALAAFGTGGTQAVINPAADDAVKKCIARYRMMPLKGPVALDSALSLIALFDQMGTKVRPQLNHDGSHFAVLSPKVLQELRLVTLAVIEDAQHSMAQAHEVGRPGLDVIKSHLNTMQAKLYRDLRAVRPAAGHASVPTQAPQSLSSESDSWMLSSDSSSAASQSTSASGSSSALSAQPSTPPRSPRMVATGVSAPAAVPKFEGIAGVSIHLPHDPMPEGLKSIKVKWPMALYNDQPFAGRQYSKLYDAAGHSLVLTQTFASGSFGKARKVFDLDEPNLNLVAKEIRHIKSRRRTPHRAAPTRVMGQMDAMAEAQLTLRLRQKIETDMRAYDALPLQHSDSLKRARAEVMPFELHGVVKNHAKTYIIMSADIGSVARISRQVIGPSHTFALKSLAAQVYSELQAMHETCAMAHLDLSEGNVFVARSGQFKIMDPGLAQPLVQGRTEKRGIRGTIMAPEHLGFSEDAAEDFYLTAATDVFTAAALVVNFAALDKIAHVFDNNFRMPGTKNLQESGIALFAAYAAWRKEAVEASTGRITVARILQGEDDLFSPYFAPLARAAPELCEVLVNDAMSISPKGRLPAGTLARSARSMLSRSVGDRDRFIQALQRIDNFDDRQEEFELASMFHDWENKKTSEHLLDVAARVGQPRNLPG